MLEKCSPTTSGRKECLCLKGENVWATIPQEFKGVYSKVASQLPSGNSPIKKGCCYQPLLLLHILITHFTLRLSWFLYCSSYFIPVVSVTPSHT